MKRILLLYFVLTGLCRAAAQFTPPVKIAYSPFYEYHHRPYDWDGDGDLDYIGGLDYSILHLYENTGAGHIANPVVIDTFPFNYSLLDGTLFADLNGDGRAACALFIKI
ncbi:MAG: VCBS repeat-containing protein [Saprospiraceae bacterium]